MELNKQVDFSTAKLLKEKGFDEKCSHYYINDFQNFKHDGKLYKTSLPNDWDNENIFQYVKRTNQFHLCNAPTIAEAVMWLYEKHKIWIEIRIHLSGGFYYKIKKCNSDDVMLNTSVGNQKSYFITPKEALEDAIIRTLKIII